MPPSNPQFAHAFAGLVAAKIGDWRGFVFPEHIAFPRHIDFRVEAAGARFVNLRLSDVRLEQEFTLTGSLFHGMTTLQNVQSIATVNFNLCTFDGPVDFLHSQFQAASFTRAMFAQRTVIRANFVGTANFNEAVFRDITAFTGWRNINVTIAGAIVSVTSSAVGAVVGPKASFAQRISQVMRRTKALSVGLRRWISKQTRAIGQRLNRRLHVLKRRVAKVDPNTDTFVMFQGEGQMQDVVFLKPEHTSFSQVDLSRVYFRGTNLRGVRFLGVNWWQPKLGRNGLFDELLIGHSQDGPFRQAYLPALEEICRNARAALEDNRNFAAASDFYIGEMEAVRRQLPFVQRHLLSVAALYRAVSRYGTSVAVALRVLACLYALHLAITMLLTGIPLDEHSTAEAALRSVQLFTLQPVEKLAPGDGGMRAWMDTVFRVLVTVQLAMIVFAFRSRIKRH